MIPQRRLYNVLGSNIILIAQLWLFLAAFGGVCTLIAGLLYPSVSTHLLNAQVSLRPDYYIMYVLVPGILSLTFGSLAYGLGYLRKRLVDHRGVHRE